MLTWAITGSLLAAAASLHSGDYGDLKLAVDGSALTGFFYSETGAGKFSCGFYLEGKLEGGSAAIRTRYPGDKEDPEIPGTLTATGSREGSEELTIALDSEHGGCWNVMHFADKKEPASFSLEAKHEWKSIRVVKSKQAHFHDAPEAAERKAYVIEGNAVGVTGTRPGWVKAEFGKVSGWLRESDLYPR